MEDYNNVVEEVVENVQPETVNNVIESAKKGLSSGGYIAIGATATLLGVGLGYLAKIKIVDPLIEKRKAKKVEKKASESEEAAVEENDNEEE